MSIDLIMLDIQFEIGGRKLDPCFIGDSVEKTTLLYVARLLRKKFSAIYVPDREDPLRVVIKGEDVQHLHYELDGPQSVMQQVREKLGDVKHEEILLPA